MKKIISTLTAMTFALGLAAAAQAQIAKTPEKPEVKTTQAQTQVTPKEPVKAGEPAAKEAVKTGDKTKEVVKPGDKGKVKQETKKATKQGGVEKKAGAPMETAPAAK
ncbi:MAG: hypothetical protein WC443_01040 [Desulfobaccales bacterium]